MMSSGFDERADIASRFGVSDAQVQRDYLISFVLAHLAQWHADSVLFIGGTALARTHLPNGRLSEDIDLIALGRRTEIADRLTRDLPRAVLRRFGNPPMLLFNSSHELIPLDQMTTFADRLRAAGVPVRTQVLPGSRHAVSYGDDAIGPTLDFLDGQLRSS